jgi:hypothetical protein
MKGKSIFTKEEAEQIVLLIEQKLIADSKRQKGIRQKIHNLGFHAQELGVGNGYTVADFKRVVTIIGSETIKSDILPKKQSVVKASVPIKLTLSESTIQKQFSTVFSKDSIAELKNIGFKGFISVEKIIESYDVLPKQKGVYILIHSAENPNFQAIGTGGDFKQREPNVSIDELKKNWVKDSPIIYIGKAGSENGSATLHSRLKQYFNFGQGKAVGHWGGRYIWQLEQSYNTIVCWLETPDIDPRIVEAEMIKQFVKKYSKRPFANLVG